MLLDLEMCLLMVEQILKCMKMYFYVSVISLIKVVWNKSLVQMSPNLYRF